MLPANSSERTNEHKIPSKLRDLVVDATSPYGEQRTWNVYWKVWHGHMAPHRQPDGDGEKVNNKIIMTRQHYIVYKRCANNGQTFEFCFSYEMYEMIIFYVYFVWHYFSYYLTNEGQATATFTVTQLNDSKTVHNSIETWHMARWGNHKLNESRLRVRVALTTWMCLEPKRRWKYFENFLFECMKEREWKIIKKNWIIATHRLLAHSLLWNSLMCNFAVNGGTSFASHSLMRPIETCRWKVAVEEENVCRQRNREYADMQWEPL